MSRQKDSSCVSGEEPSHIVESIPTEVTETEPLQTEDDTDVSNTESAIVFDGFHMGGSSVTDAESRVSEWVVELGLSK